MEIITTKIITMGILTVPLTNSRINKFKNHNENPNDKYNSDQFNSDKFLEKVSFYGTNYSTWLESSNIKTIPLIMNESKKKLLKILEKINGVLFTGGAAKMFDSKNLPTKYLKTVKFIVDFAKEQNNKGKYFFIWGTCLGHESVMNSLNMKDNLSLVKNQFKDYMNHHSSFDNSKLGSFLNINGLFEKDIFYYYNKFGFSVEKFKKNLVFKKEAQFFATVKNSFSEFVGYVEFKNYPFFLPLFHIEKKKDIKNKELNDLRKVVQRKMADFVRHSIEKNSTDFLTQKGFDKINIRQHFNHNFYHFITDPEHYFYLEEESLLNIEDGKIKH